MPNYSQYHQLQLNILIAAQENNRTLERVEADYVTYFLLRAKVERTAHLRLGCLRVPRRRILNINNKKVEQFFR